MGRTTCDLLVERLTDWGVDTIFGLPGDGINGFMESLRTAQGRIRFIHVRHEEVGALAACAYAKFTGKLGVCMSTAGPGAVHLLNGLYDAKCDQAPVLAITGMPYHDLIGTNYLQDINQDYLFDNVALYNQRVMGPAHISNLADQACRTALGRRGPTHLCIPIDIQHQEVSAGHRSHRNLKGHTSTRFQPPARTPEKDELELAASALKGKRKIAILAGQGARGAGREAGRAHRQGAARQRRRPRRQPVLQAAQPRDGHHRWTPGVATTILVGAGMALAGSMLLWRLRGHTGRAGR